MQTTLDSGFVWVPNPRKEVLQRARHQVEPKQLELNELLTTSIGLMLGPTSDRAWAGGASEQFLDELREERKKATRAGHETSTRLHEAYLAEPDELHLWRGDPALHQPN